MPSSSLAIVVHGGAGDWPRSLHRSALAGVEKAANIGFEILAQGGTSLETVERAVVSMEDNPIFNAGKGSALNLLGEVEDDAAIMDGRYLRGGAVALLGGIKNPVRVARIVMEKTNHVLIAGESARKLALDAGVPRASLKVPSRVQAWKKSLKNLKGRRSRLASITHKEVIDNFLSSVSDTVGALALDSKGDLAAADSTGGMLLKLPGRIGDSAILGAGLYADNRLGAATATGIGEIAIKLAISKSACDLMSREPAPRAATRTVHLATKILGGGIGLITLDKQGRYGVAHNTRNLCWAARTSRSGLAHGMFGERVSR